MYNRISDKLLEGLMCAALDEIMLGEYAEYTSKDDSDNAYPTSKKMSRKYRRKVAERKYRNPMSIVYLKRVAVIVLCMISAVFVLLSTSVEVRAAMKSAVVTWYDEYVNIDFSKPETSDTSENDDTATEDVKKTFNDLEILYIPEGYETADHSQNELHREYMYTYADGSYLLIVLCPSDNIDFYADATDTEFTEMTVGGRTAYLVYDNSESTGSLFVKGEEYAIWISYMGKRDTLIKIGENIK